MAKSKKDEEGLADAVARLEPALRRVAAAITPNICGGDDATGSHVESLTEAVMGVTGGLVRIAEAIDGLAAAVRSHG